MGKSSARLRLDAALEAEEDGTLAWLQEGRAVQRDEAQYDVRELRLHGDHCQCELQERRSGYPVGLWSDVANVLWPGLLRQDGVCLARVRDLHQHVQRATVHAEGARECRGLLCVVPAAAAPPDLMHWQEAAERLVVVHDSFCADSVLVHQPAQLDEEPVRVGALLLRAVDLFHALGGLLAAQAHAEEELSDRLPAGTHVESHCVEPFEHQASDRHRAEAQDVGHSQDVLAQQCHVCG